MTKTLKAAALVKPVRLQTITSPLHEPVMDGGLPYAIRQVADGSFFLFRLRQNFEEACEIIRGERHNNFRMTSHGFDSAEELANYLINWCDSDGLVTCWASPINNFPQNLCQSTAQRVGRLLRSALIEAAKSKVLRGVAAQRAAHASTVA